MLDLDQLNGGDVLAEQTKTLAAPAEIRAGAGPGLALTGDGVAVTLAGDRPVLVHQGQHAHFAAAQGKLRPSQPVNLHLGFDHLWICHRVFCDLLCLELGCMPGCGEIYFAKQTRSPLNQVNTATCGDWFLALAFLSNVFANL